MFSFAVTRAFSVSVFTYGASPMFFFLNISFRLITQGLLRVPSFQTSYLLHFFLYTFRTPRLVLSHVIGGGGIQS
jgi:hypothetical protein